MHRFLIAAAAGVFGLALMGAEHGTEQKEETGAYEEQGQMEEMEAEGQQQEQAAEEQQKEEMGQQAQRAEIDEAEIQEVMGADAKVIDLNSLEADKIKDLQRQLSDRGYYEGDIDGLVGPATTSALNSFLSHRFEVSQKLINQNKVTGDIVDVLGLDVSELQPVRGLESEEAEPEQPAEEMKEEGEEMKEEGKEMKQEGEEMEREELPPDVEEEPSY